MAEVLVYVCFQIALARGELKGPYLNGALRNLVRGGLMLLFTWRLGLIGVPLGSLCSSLLVSAWWYGRRLPAYLSVPARGTGAVWRLAVLVLGIPLVCWAVSAECLAPATTWPGVLIYGTAFSIGAGLLLSVFDAGFMEQVRVLARRWRPGPCLR
jgi:peptidoglycan biosynthesis protein MviN/MurJ (putative lipid II flippase)